jgi:hypothetical protein
MADDASVMTRIVLVATWRDGLFVVAGEDRDQELGTQSVRALAPDGHGGALAIVNGRTLRRRTPDGVCAGRDGGESWDVEQEGMHASYCSAVAFAGDDVLVSVSVDHFASQGVIYRRLVEGRDSLAAVREGLPAWTDASWTPIASPRTAPRSQSQI